ncbi:MAG: (2Fe-2S)-binding protein, partial [Chloroflexia bacterium]
MPRIRFTLNGEPVEVEIDPDERLAYVLRERLGLTGTKIGCGEGECGACTVLVDGISIVSCI